MGYDDLVCRNLYFAGVHGSVDYTTFAMQMWASSVFKDFYRVN